MKLCYQIFHSALKNKISKVENIAKFIYSVNEIEKHVYNQ